MPAACPAGRLRVQEPPTRSLFPPITTMRDRSRAPMHEASASLLFLETRLDHGELTTADVDPMRIPLLPHGDNERRRGPRSYGQVASTTAHRRDCPLQT